MSFKSKHIAFCQITLIAIILMTQNLYAKSQKNAKPLEPPQLKKGEYALYLDDKYKIFKTTKIDDIEIEVSCIKKNGPNCNAFSFSKIKPKELQLKPDSTNNLAALHCADISGRNLIALDSKRNEYNFCYFKDGSMANSWSIYFKHHPVPVIK